MEPAAWNIPIMPLRGLTVFPHMNLTFDVERRLSIVALEKAMETEQEIFLVTQRDLSDDSPGQEDLYEVGTVSHISQILRLSPSAVRVMVEGRCRARLKRLWQTEPFLQGNVEELPEGGTAILNYDNELIRAWPVKNSVKIISYGIHINLGIR